MEYKELGKTGMKLSRLGFGAMRLPMKSDFVDRDLSTPLLHRAFELGINFIDSGVGYCNRDSEKAVGDALKSWKGNKIYLSAKNPDYEITDEKKWWINLENSLNKFGVKCIDLYNHHGMGLKTYQDVIKPPNGLYKLMLKAKNQGMIKHIGFSYHDSPENLKTLLDISDGQFESVILQHNFLDRIFENVLPYIKQKGLGVIVMGPVGGGRLSVPSSILKEKPGINTPEIALRFVFADPNVDVALSGMSDMAQLEENVKTASSITEFGEKETKQLVELVEKCRDLAKIYCTGCAYCMPCPNEVNIPLIFQYYIWDTVYGLHQIAVDHYANLGKPNSWTTGKHADACKECKACLKKCPQKIEIIEQLKKAHISLSGK